MTITALPTSPSRAAAPATFSAQMDTFLGALPTFVTEANALSTDVNAKQSAAAASASNALTSANNAASSAASAAASLSAIDMAVGLVIVAVTGTSLTATAGNLYVLQNAAATTITLPAAPANGDTIGFKVSNDRIDNLIARNGKLIEGLAQDLTLDNRTVAFKLIYVDSVSQWRLF